MKFIDYFEHIYIINLPYRQDRRRMITRQLEAAGMPITLKKVEIFPAIRPDHAEGFPNIGARGAFLSHLTILKQAQQQHFSNVLILEDDVIIFKHFQKYQEQIVEQLKQVDWDLVCFGHQEKEQDSSVYLQPPKISKEASMAEYLKLGYLPTTDHATPVHFYGVNATIFARLISFLERAQYHPPGHPHGGATHLDGVYTIFGASNPDVTILKAFPNLGFQASIYSDIHASKWFDQTIGLKQLAMLARKGKNWFKAQQFNG